VDKCKTHNVSCYYWANDWYGCKNKWCHRFAEKTREDNFKEYNEYIHLKAREYLTVEDDEFVVFEIASIECAFKKKLSFEEYMDGYRL
jgi:hypothetical protein